LRITSPRANLQLCPRGGVRAGWVWPLRAGWPVRSGCRGGQLDERIIAQRCEGFQCHVARPRDSPLIVLLEQDGTDQAGNGDADNLGAALDLTVQSYQWIGRVDLGPVVPGKLIKASTSVSASSIRAASLVTLGLI
jgi:hypothetical protein